MLLLALIAAVVSYSHMYELALRHGEPEWRAALFPLPVDGMIVTSSELLMREFQANASSVRSAHAGRTQTEESRSDAKHLRGQVSTASDASKVTDLQAVHDGGIKATAEPALSPFQARTWRWALERQRETGELPSGKEIAVHFGRKERWGRLVKQ